MTTLPTIARSITDLVRTSPYVNAFSPTGGDTVPSVAGRNSWFNTIQIDGAVHNDLYGASRSGSPGGQSGSQPISLEVVREIQLVVAPYDVRQGGFSAGGLNIVTNGGGNDVHGALYGFEQNEQFVGRIPALIGSELTSVGPFSSRQFGGSLGGPLVRNRAFLFGNVESSRQSTPNVFSIAGDAGQPWGHQAEVTDVLDIVRSHYGYDAGSLGQVVNAMDNDKAFLRSDVNLRGGRLTARVNYLNGRLDLGTPTALMYIMPDSYGHFGERVWSDVAQLNSTRGRILNEFRAGMQRYRAARKGLDGHPTFPAVRVDFADGTNVRLGTDPLSFANSLSQDVVELTDDLTWARGAHTFTVGTHAEWLHFQNLFVQNLYGLYEFSSVDNLRAGVAQAFTRQFSNTSDPRQAEPFAAGQYSAYAGDVWRTGSRLTLTYGLRIDVPGLPDRPRSNPLALSEFGYATDVAPATVMWSPRAGFNWQLGGESDGRTQLRGGAGLFSGRPPYAWIANQYINTGLDYTTLTVPLATTNRIAFIADPNAQPTNVGGAGRQTINLIDPAFSFPQVLRGNLAFDRGLGVFGLVGTVELVASKTVNDPAYTTSSPSALRS